TCAPATHGSSRAIASIAAFALRKPIAATLPAEPARPGATPVPAPEGGGGGNPCRAGGRRRRPPAGTTQRELDAMRDILGLGRIAGGLAARPTRGAGGAFRLPDASGAAAGASAAGSAMPVGALSVQETDDPRTRNGRGAARATALLADLSSLQA